MLLNKSVVFWVLYLVLCFSQKLPNVVENNSVGGIH